MPGEHVKEINAPDFGAAVLQRSHDLPVVVDFWAEWCGPCRTLGPLLERLAEEYDGAFELVKVDVDANQALAQQFGVQGIPYVMAFRGGQPVNEFTGALPESQVRAWLDTVVPSQLDLQVDEARTAMLDGNNERSEELLRGVLAEKMDHEEAGTALASLYLSRGENALALDVLAPLSPTSDVEKLRATARLTSSEGADLPALSAVVEADPEDDAARIELAKALAAGAEFEPALDHYLAVVRNKGERLNEARTAMIDIFEVLGADHPLSLTYRRELASALY
ncbi:MAG: thioredoxin [Acidimicrobiia bacterium]|nr:thioredoxin [Acidimicrobiia bacterium]MBT8193398.1 thioredoxin [Acidimicrobiia bacterium]NNF88216.1 thioredoxin [Acidimicrobiia bacterium]NNL98426.1 thioredoxin [Acidimicrobiia bacterium]